METAAWEAAGLYQPDAPDADERRALLEYLTERGATIDQMVEAHRTGSLPAVAGDLVRAADQTTLSLEELAARSGVTVERAQRVLLSLGLVATPTDAAPLSLAGVIDSFEQGAALMGDDAIFAFTRVLGAAATNIAEAAVALFYAELGPGTAREGPDALARARMSETATLAFATVPDVLERVLMAQFDRASRRAVLARGWSTEPTPTVDGEVGGPSETVALGFVDLVGSTAWAEGLTLRDHSLALSRFESAAWTSAVLADGRVVKMIGDEVFFAAPSVDAACRIATELCRAAEADPVLPSARGAVGHGLVVPREGDYFGPLVNVVSRLVKVADAGGVVVTFDAAAALPTDRWTVHELDPQRLRGVDQPIRTFTVAEAPAPPA